MATIMKKPKQPRKNKNKNKNSDLKVKEEKENITDDISIENMKLIIEETKEEKETIKEEKETIEEYKDINIKEEKETIKEEIGNLKDLIGYVIRIFIRNHNIVLENEELNKEVEKVIPEIGKTFSIIQKKKSTRVKLHDSEMCMGRKIDNLRCTRRKLNKSEFCKAHNNKLVNGRYDKNIETPKKTPNKRGRKRKVSIDPKQYNDDYITLWEDCVDGEKRLVDKFSNVYTIDVNKPVYLGKKSLDGKLIIPSKLPELLT